ncbi:hypothetical protein AK830_g1582 [Neonectria ditissima]|uniref:Flavoprotein domain-containing protein n=1 Tax=Neonectria ditissima TaxID=78410 RepID=A0A0P7BTY3_9HYPO|nr:hypothetical protein AK830_g1582 [Neonectria ditissima]
MLHMTQNGRDAHHDLLVRNSPEALEQSRSDHKRHVLLAASGSVATIKLVQIIEGLSRRDDISIRVILTSSAVHFLAGQSHEQPTVSAINYMPNVDAVYTDSSEWATPWKRGAPILHINLRKWADVLVIAPLSANTLAKMVNGLCDNLLTSVIRAWDATGTVDGGIQKKIVVAPSMNTAMWRHPITAKQIKTLEEEWGGENGWVEVLRPISKALACGDVGEGGMVTWQVIVSVIEVKIGGKKFLPEQPEFSLVYDRLASSSSSLSRGHLLFFSVFRFCTSSPFVTAMNMKSHQNETSSPGFWTENINPPSTLRDRLRNQDVAVPASPKPPTYDHVYQQFRASFGADLEPTRRNDPGPSAAENRDADAVTQLRGEFG